MLWFQHHITYSLTPNYSFPFYPNLTLILKSGAKNQISSVFVPKSHPFVVFIKKTYSIITTIQVVSTQLLWYKTACQRQVTHLSSTFREYEMTANSSHCTQCNYFIIGYQKNKNWFSVARSGFRALFSYCIMATKGKYKVEEEIYWRCWKVSRGHYCFRSFQGSTTVFEGKSDLSDFDLSSCLRLLWWRCN